jgi:hypothetical protein
MRRLMVHGHNLEMTRELHSYIQDVITATLAPFGRRIGVVCVRLYGATDPDARPSCYIRVDLHPSGGLALGESAPEPKQAILRAAQRIGVSVAREIEHSQGRRNLHDRSQAFLA